MNHKIIYQCILGLLLIFSLTSCSSARKAKKSVALNEQIEYVGQRPTNDTLQLIDDFKKKVKDNQISFNTFNAKAKVNFTDKNDKNTDVNVIIRIQKDSAIWVSVNALLGIEAARVLVTPDSVKLINKLDKKIVEHAVSHLQELVNLPLDFRALQDLLIGNPIYLDDSLVAYQKGDDQIKILSVNDKIKSTLQFDQKKSIFLSAILSELDITKDRVSTILNSEYEKKNKRWFSLLRNISVQGSTKANIVIQFKQYEFDTPVNFPFNYPKDYTK